MHNDSTRLNLPARFATAFLLLSAMAYATSNYNSSKSNSANITIAPDTPGAVGKNVVVDGQGHFECAGLAPGKYTITLTYVAAAPSPAPGPAAAPSANPSGAPGAGPAASGIAIKEQGVQERPSTPIDSIEIKGVTSATRNGISLRAMPSAAMPAAAMPSAARPSAPMPPAPMPVARVIQNSDPAGFTLSNFEVIPSQPVVLHLIVGETRKIEGNVKYPPAARRINTSKSNL